MNTQLESFFQSLNAEADLQRFVDDKREEDLYLEFKEKRDRRDGLLHDNDRYNFSKSMSSFANADGGILVFGISTKHQQDHPDRADDLKPITDASRLRVSLLDSVLTTTQPPVDGVRIELIPGTAITEGYVKCLIPASDMPPHRAILADREYWRRTSNGTRKMDHYELEEVFGRRRRPVLHVQARLVVRPELGDEEALHFSFVNVGRGLAYHAGLFCKFGAGTAVVHTFGGLSDASPLNDNAPSVLWYDPHTAIHPNGLSLAIGSALIRRPDRGKPLQIYVKWYAENMSAKEASTVIQPDQVTVLKG
jgi:hypothetical protein